MLFLAELYLPRGGSLADVARLARAGAAAAAGAGPEVRFVQAIFVPLDESCFVLYHAESAADVTAAGTRAGLNFDRVAAALATWLSDSSIVTGARCGANVCGFPRSRRIPRSPSVSCTSPHSTRLGGI